MRIVAVVVLALLSLPSQAQYLSLNLRGDIGLKSGTLPGPGYYVTLPLFYQADYSSIRLPGGQAVPGDFGAKINLFAPAIAVTTKLKVLGANYGFQVVPAFQNQRLSFAEQAVQLGGAYGFADLYIQPLSLGWTTKRADFAAKYGFYAPTGSGNRTLDMWAHELVAGSTVYFDEGKHWHASGSMFYTINQRKRSIDVKVGDFLTIEGGVGRSFLKGAGSAGLAYVAQWKVTGDSGTAIPPRFPGTKNKAYGLGPEFNMPVFAKGSVVGLLGFRYVFEFGNSTNFQGNNLLLSFTLAKLSL